MLGHAGYFTELPSDTLWGMIDFVKAIEPEIGYPPILRFPKTEAAMREARVKQHEDGLHLLRRRLQLRYLDERPAHFEGRTARGSDEQHLHLCER